MPLQISDKTRALAKQAEEDLKEQFTFVDSVAQANAEKVLDAFQTHRVSESYFAGTTGYGYDDLGRDKLDEIYAHIFRTEDALVQAIVEEYDTTEACARKDVRAFIKQLQEQDLLL